MSVNMEMESEASALKAMDALRADIMRADADDPRETDGLLRRALVEGIKYTRLPRWRIDDDEYAAKKNFMNGKNRVRGVLDDEGEGGDDLWSATSALMAGAVYLGGGALGCACGCGEDGGFAEWAENTPLIDVSSGFRELSPAGESLALELARIAVDGELFSALRLWVYSNGERPWLSDAAHFLAFAMMRVKGREKELARGALALLHDID